MIILQGASSGSRRVQGSGSGIILRGLLASENFTPSLLPKTVLISESSSTTIMVDDTVLTESVGAVTTTSADIQAMVPLNGYANGPAQYFSSNTSVATINENTGVTSYVGPGTTVLSVYVPGLDMTAK